MSIFDLLLVAVGLSMDAFAVAVCKGMSMSRISFRNMLVVGLWFGGFQALMPLLGYLLGSQFASYITSVDHWIAFILLSIIGGKMIYEALRKDDAEDGRDSAASLSFSIMFVLAVATSIDALVTGITFAFLQTNIWIAVVLIGSTTFILSALGTKAGNIFGIRLKSNAEIAGGVILCLLGLKILLEHLGVF